MIPKKKSGKVIAGKKRSKKSRAQKEKGANQSNDHTDGDGGGSLGKKMWKKKMMGGVDPKAEWVLSSFL